MRIVLLVIVGNTIFLDTKHYCTELLYPLPLIPLTNHQEGNYHE
jgi:hypothetical protein